MVTLRLPSSSLAFAFTHVSPTPAPLKKVACSLYQRNARTPPLASAVLPLLRFPRSLSVLSPIAYDSLTLCVGGPTPFPPYSRAGRYSRILRYPFVRHYYSRRSCSLSRGTKMFQFPRDLPRFYDGFPSWFRDLVSTPSRKSMGLHSHASRSV